MLYELKQTRQIPGENKRRWFTSLDMDLIVWFGSNNKLVSFELCYNKQANENSLRWSAAEVIHSSVDSGEEHPGKYKATPVLREVSHFDVDRVQGIFSAECQQIPQEISNFVMTALQSYGSNIRVKL